MSQASNEEKKPFHDRAEKLRKEYLVKLEAFHNLQREEATAKRAQENAVLQELKQRQKVMAVTAERNALAPPLATSAMHLGQHLK